MIYDYQTHQLINPSNNKPYICKECHSPLTIQYADFIGMKYTPFSAYVLLLSCPHRHQKALIVPRRAIEPLMTYFKPKFTKKDFIKINNNYYFHPDTHNIPFSFFTTLTKYVEKDPNPPFYHEDIIHSYIIKDPNKIIDAYKRYLTSLERVQKYIQKKNKKKKRGQK